MATLTTHEGVVLTDDVDIVSYLRAQATEAEFNADDLPAENIISLVNNTKRDDDPATFLADLMDAIQEAAEANVPDDTGDAVVTEKDTADEAASIANAFSATKPASGDHVIMVSASPRAALAYRFAIRSLEDKVFNEHMETAFKANEFRQKSALYFLLDLKRMYGNDLKEWPRVPLSDEDIEEDLARSKREGVNAGTYAYKTKRNDKEVKRTFPQDFFDRSTPGQKVLHTIDALKSEKAAKEKSGVFLAQDVINLDSSIGLWEGRLKSGADLIRNAMKLNQQIEDVRATLPAVTIVLHTVEHDGHDVPYDGKYPILLMPSDPKLQGYKSNYPVSVASFLTMDPQKALATGATVEALVLTNNRQPEAGGGKNYGEAKNAVDVEGHSIVINSFFGAPENERHLDDALTKRPKGEKTKYTDEANNLLWHLEELKDNLVRFLGSPAYRERVAAMNAINKKSAA